MTFSRWGKLVVWMALGVGPALVLVACSRFQPRPANPSILPRLLPFLGKDLGTWMKIVTGRDRLHLDNH